MDRLDEIAAVARPLLRRVDDLITAVGAPAGHRLWAQVRRVGLLPTDAVDAVAALRPAPLDDAAPWLRDRARDYAALAASLPAPGDWSGDAAGAYDAGRRRMADHLSDDPRSLAERLEASADLGDALVDWMRATRAGVAYALADVLVSAEAVPLAGSPGAGPPTAVEALAAADVGARLLRAVADGYDEAEELLTGSAGLTRARSAPAAWRTAAPDLHW